jgi:Spy/CpxP family protein refolding chaperone
MVRKINALVALMNVSTSPVSTAIIFLTTAAWRSVTKEFLTMKRSLVCALLTAALSCGAAAAYAQTQDNVPPSQVQEPGAAGAPAAPGAAGRQMPTSAQRLQRMTDALNLTSDQQEKIKPILDSESQQMQQLRSDSSLSQQDRRSKMMQIRQGSHDQIKAILTPDQLQKFDQMGPGGSMHREGGPPPLK